MTDTVEKQLAREQLTSRFYKQCEETAQCQIAALNKELQEAKAEVTKQTELTKKVEGALAVSESTVEQLTAQCRVLQAEIADRGKKFEVERLALLEQVSQEKRKTAIRDSIEDLHAKMVPVLQSQVKILSEVVSGKSEAHSAFALQCSREFDAILLEQRVGGLEEQLRTTRDELEHTKYLYREERIEGQRAAILCQLYRSMLDTPKCSSSSSASAHSSPSRSPFAKLAGAKADSERDSPGLRGKMEELAKENADFKHSLLSLNSQMTEMRILSAEALDQNVSLKRQLDECRQREAIMEAGLSSQRAAEAVRQASLTQRQLEQGAVVGLLSSCLMHPIRCPHCRFGLGDSVGLEMVAAGMGLPSVDAVLSAMVESLAESVSRTFHESHTDIVTRVSPAVTLSAATGLSAHVPQVVMFLPPYHFSQFIDLLGAVSEAQCYALAVKYMTDGARFVVNQTNVDLVLDAVRFLWLPTALVESEISRIEAEIAASNSKLLMASLQGRAHHHQHAADSDPPVVARGHIVPHGLLLRLIQTLRFKSVVVQAELLKMGSSDRAHPQRRGGGGFQDDSCEVASMELSPAVLEELHRIRHSYGFIPVTMRHEIRGRAISTASLLSLQLICM